MKTPTVAALVLSLGLQICSASQIAPPELIVPNFARIFRSERPPDTLETIDYEAIAARDKKWTKDKIHELFKSIDPDKVRFEDHEHLAEKITMLEPIRVRFIFEARRYKLVKGGPSAPPINYYLVGIETNPETKQNKAEMATPRKPSD